MNPNAKFIVIILGVLFCLIACREQESKNDYFWVASSPAGSRFTSIDRNGETILPNGRIITPAGKSVTVAPHPFGLTLSRDGSVAVTANSGTSPLSISIIHNVLTDSAKVIQVPPGYETDEGVLASVFMGLAISPDNRIVFVGGGQENKIFLFETETGKPAGFIDCTDTTGNSDYSHGYIGDLRLSADGSTVYAVDQIGFRVVIADTKSRNVLASVPVGRYPFGITLSEDGSRAYVANVGMFTYAPIKDGKNGKIKLIDFPPTGFNTGEMINGIENDTMSVPGLGDPNVPESFSVFILDISERTKPVVKSKIKTGHLVGSLVEGIPAVGGSSPNSIAVTEKYVFVSNGNNDNISVISNESDTVVNTIYLKPDKRIKQFRGVIPFGLAVSPDKRTLFVAEAGINAIAVIDTRSLEVLGHIPAGWFPSKVEVSSDGRKLVIANAKGFGSGPNGGAAFRSTGQPGYIGSLMKGTVEVVDIPVRKALRKMTEKVIANNFLFTRSDDTLFTNRRTNPVPAWPDPKASPIKHIIFVSKENRTYDEVFGQVKKGDGDSTLARYGRNVSFRNKKGNLTVENATVMPNHLALAERFGISDNFYVDSDVSADGHRWLVNTYPNEWCETSTAASYGGNRQFRENSTAPGVWAMNGAAGAIYPEDYNEAGSMWDHLERNGIEFFNFGFSVMFEPAVYDEKYKYTGIKHYVNYPVPQPMFNRSSRIYPTYNTAIPDQFRIDQFIEEFNSKWLSGKDTLPSLITVIVPNDHGAGERPEAGYPFRESYMADNDLAIGRLVEFLSHTPYWKNMAVFITEDDAQNGVDHVDAHRSILMVISPWAKRGHVSHYHYSFGSLFKTYWNILGIPYLNQYDAGANDLSDFFSDSPDFTPYRALPADKRFFDPQKALDPFDEKFNWKALSESPELDNVKDMIRESKEKDEYRLENREKIK